MKKIKVFAAALMFVVAANVSAMAANNSAVDCKSGSNLIEDCTLVMTAADGTKVEVNDPGCKRTKAIIAAICAALGIPF